MNKQRPSEEGQARFSAPEMGRTGETEDRPELPLEERLERAAGRFEERVLVWEQQSLSPDLEPRLDEIDQWLGHVQQVLEGTERVRIGAVPFMEARMDSAEADERRAAMREARRNPRISQLTPERREQLADKQAAIRRNQVLGHHGAARWYERPGNAERLTELHGAINRQRLGLEAA